MFQQFVKNFFEMQRKTELIGLPRMNVVAVERACQVVRSKMKETRMSGRCIFLFFLLASGFYILVCGCSILVDKIYTNLSRDVGAGRAAGLEPPPPT